MTQGNVTLNLRNILNGVLKRPPLKLSTSPETSLRDFYISTRITPGLGCTSLKIGLVMDRH